MKFCGCDINYGLHDTQISNIEICEDKLELLFDLGFYILDDAGRETCRTSSGKIELEIANFNIDNAYEHIVIIKSRKCKVKEIKLIEFMSKLKRNKFDINIDFYSSFNNTLLLKGFIGKFEIEFIVSEIKNISFIA